MFFRLCAGRQTETLQYISDPPPFPAAKNITPAQVLFENYPHTHWRIFFRHTALKILEIRQDSREFLPCPAKKTSPLGALPINKQGLIHFYFSGFFFQVARGFRPLFRKSSE